MFFKYFSKVYTHLLTKSYQTLGSWHTANYRWCQHFKIIGRTSNSSGFSFTSFPIYFSYLAFPSFTEEWSLERQAKQPQEILAARKQWTRWSFFLALLFFVSAGRTKQVEGLEAFHLFDTDYSSLPKI